MLAVSGMDGFVGPIEIHVVFAERVSVFVELLRASELVPDVLGLEKVQHSETINRILTGGAVVNVGSKRNFCGLKSPPDEALITHAAVARFVVGPASGVVNPFPWKHVGEGTQHDTACLNRPNFVDVADGRAQLELQSLTIGEVWIDDVGPIKTTWPETRVASWTLRNRVSLRSDGDQRCVEGRCGANAHAPKLRQRALQRFSKGICFRFRSRGTRQRVSRPFLECRDLFCLLRERKGKKAVSRTVRDQIGSIEVLAVSVLQRRQQHLADGQKKGVGRRRVLCCGEQCDQGVVGALMLKESAGKSQLEDPIPKRMRRFRTLPDESRDAGLDVERGDCRDPCRLSDQQGALAKEEAFQ